MKVADLRERVKCVWYSSKLQWELQHLELLHPVSFIPPSDSSHRGTEMFGIYSYTFENQSGQLFLSHWRGGEKRLSTRTPQRLNWEQHKQCSTKQQSMKHSQFLMMYLHRCSKRIMNPKYCVVTNNIKFVSTLENQARKCFKRGHRLLNYFVQL